MQQISNTELARIGRLLDERASLHRWTGTDGRPTVRLRATHPERGPLASVQSWIGRGRLNSAGYRWALTVDGTRAVPEALATVRPYLRRLGPDADDLLRRHPWPRPQPRCAVEGCHRPRRAGGLCDTHYRRRRRATDAAPSSDAQSWLREHGIHVWSLRLAAPSGSVTGAGEACVDPARLVAVVFPGEDPGLMLCDTTTWWEAKPSDVGPEQRAQAIAQVLSYRRGVPESAAAGWLPPGRVWVGTLVAAGRRS